MQGTICSCLHVLASPARSRMMHTSRTSYHSHATSQAGLAADIKKNKTMEFAVLCSYVLHQSTQASKMVDEVTSAWAMLSFRKCCQVRTTLLLPLLPLILLSRSLPMLHLWLPAVSMPNICTT